ncbi:MAG: FkbM family methyltransferase [Pyrinomonadaceae bacterium]
MGIRGQVNALRYRATHAAWESIWVAQDILTLRNWPAVVADRLRHKVGKRPSGNTLKMRNGLSFSLHPGSSALYTVFVEIFYLLHYNRHPLFKIKSRDVVVDIGANVGFFTVKAAHEAREGKVYAYEPCSMHFDLLSENVRRNKLDNVSVFKEAVWKETDKLELLFSLETEPNNTSLFSGGGGDRKETVDSVSLKDVFERNRIDSCDFLKLDCEGAEYEILFNAPDEVLGSIKKIAMEWHRFDPSHTPDKLARFLETKGFTLAGEPDWTQITGHIYAYRQ